MVLRQKRVKIKNRGYSLYHTKVPLILIGKIIFFAGFTLLSLSSCSQKVAQVGLPYDSLENFSLPGETALQDEWWLAFEDEELNVLIDSALHSNLSLQAVWHQFQEAMAVVDIAASARVPEIFLELQSGISRPEPDFVGGENTQLSLRSNYEVDLWGRIKYTVQAEENRFRASYQDYQTAAISLSAEIALTWFRLKATKFELELVKEQEQANEQVLALIRARFASGQVRGVDILRQEQLIENTREQRIGLEMQLSLLNNQLSILLGQPPQLDFDISPDLPEPSPLPQTGIPLQLVNRRPDVQSAFYRLQAADQEVAAAISNKYPRLNFSLTAAVRSNTLIGLFESQAASLTSSLLAPLFYGGRLRAEVNRTEAVKQQFRNDYGQAVLIAFREIEDALVQEMKQLDRIEAIERQVLLAERAYEQLKIEYLNGSLAYLDVLVTLGQQQQLRRDLITAKLNLLEFRISLYRSLAGGFETPLELNQELPAEN
jgi:outer membrane protein, multidrug efflux system